jgi:peroxiredoxin
MNENFRPGAVAPPLSFDTVGGVRWSLHETRPATLDLIAVYRGFFCPYCKDFISKLASRLPAFAERGIAVTAVSMDDKDRAARASKEWSLGALPVGYGISAETARQWNVFLTTREQEGRKVTFCEPAVFFVTPSKHIFAIMLQSIPCGRPDLGNLLDGIDYLGKQGYPIRGAA